MGDKVEITQDEYKTLIANAAENRLRIQARVLMSVISFLGNIVKLLMVFCVCFYAYHSIIVLAGKNTDVHIIIKLVASVATKHKIAVSGGLVGLLGVLYGKYQKKLRQDTTKRLTNENKRLKDMLETETATSNLTEIGTTNPEDM